MMWFLSAVSIADWHGKCQRTTLFANQPLHFLAFLAEDVGSLILSYEFCRVEAFPEKMIPSASRKRKSRMMSSGSGKRLKIQVPARAVWSGLLAGLIVLLITCLSGAALYLQSVQALKSEVRNNLIRTATVAAAMVDGDAHATFTSPQQETTPAYFRAIEPLSRVEKASGDIKYVYTCILKQNKVYFVLDPTPPGDHDGNGVDDKIPHHAAIPRSGCRNESCFADRHPAGRPGTDCGPVGELHEQLCARSMTRRGKSSGSSGWI